MKTIVVIVGMLLGMVVAAQAAQLYRWVDSKGNVEWRDTPPPASVPSKSIQERRVGGNVIGGGELPYSLQVAVKNNPITLWAPSDCGKVCEQARAHLNKRGMPYKDANPKDDAEAFKQLSPRNEVPVLMVGRQKLIGYLESTWDETLNAAGYPSSVVGLVKPPAAPPAAAAKPPADAAAPAPAAPGAAPPAATPPAAAPPQSR